jgi:hypothetical protein
MEYADEFLAVVKNPDAPKAHKALAAQLLDWLAQQKTDSDYASRMVAESNTHAVWIGLRRLATVGGSTVIIRNEERDRNAPGFVFVSSAPDPPKVNGPLITPDSIDDSEFV